MGGTVTKFGDVAVARLQRETETGIDGPVILAFGMAQDRSPLLSEQLEGCCFDRPNV